MAANLSQAFFEGAGLVPSLVQELAAGNFHEGRDSFHDYILSRLILGEDKSNNASTTKPSTSVFPNTNLISESSNPLSVLSNPYSQISNSHISNSHLGVENTGIGSVAGEDSHTLTIPSLTKSLIKQKSDNSKKKSSQAEQGIAQQVIPECPESTNKLKKKNQYKKKEKTNVCNVCGRGFAEKYTLTRHMLTHTRIKPYSCSKCNMSFSRSDGLAKHMAAGHRRVDAHHCDVCGGTFNSELSFEQHRREYGNTLPFVCNLCMLAFSQCCHLNYHMKSHSLSKMNDGLGYDVPGDKNNGIDESELIPDDCNPPKKDQHDISVGKLMDSINRAAGKGQNCLYPDVVIKPEIEDFPACGAHSSKLPGNSSVHRSDEGNSPYDALDNFSGLSSASCNLASSEVSQGGNNLTLGNSVQTPSYLPHTSSEGAMVPDLDMKKYFDIKVPNPKFQPDAAARMAIMSEDGIFRCELCGKGFTRKYHMQRHVKLHTRGPVPRAHLLDWTRRPYACGVCKMGFTRQHHLTRHILIHTGERPHSCHICDKAFRRFTNLSLHIRTVHGAERPFKCHICGRGFPRLYSLQRHLKLHARNASAVSSGRVDQVYKEFQVVGTVNVESRISHNYTSVSASSVQHPPGITPEADSSDHSLCSDKFKDESSLRVESLGHTEPNENDSPMISQERFSILHEGNNVSFHSKIEQANQSKEQARSCQSGKSEDGQDQTGFVQHQKILAALESNNRIQQIRQVNPDSTILTLQNPVLSQVSNDFATSPQHGETTGSHISHQVRNLTGFLTQQSTQSTNEDRLVSANALTSQNFRMMNMSLNSNFHEPDITDTSNYPQNPRRISGDGFAVHQQRLQSPLPMMNMLERPGSRSMINQAVCPENYNHPSSGYTQTSSLQMQQHTNMNFPIARNTMTPTSMQNHGDYSHNNHVDIGVTHSSISDPTTYSHNHSMDNVPFQGNTLGLYQPHLSDSLNQMDMHPHPSASPVSASTHNLQY